MLSKEQNELITRTGPGTPLGEMMRCYWVPALQSSELPGPDCPPVQVKILGEELVAFRDSQGRLGLLEEHCAHRGTSLFYGRNEEGGLRCIYHGWKYDVHGHVLETPAEPAGSTFHERVRVRAYATHEVGGMIFAYLGEGRPPLFPNYEWTTIAPEHTFVAKSLLECNYLQGLEGECDSAHLSFLHRMLDPNEHFLYKADTHPEYHTEDTDFGVRLIALRHLPENKTYVRVTAFLMPLACALPVGGAVDGFDVHFYTPIDDTHAWRFDFSFKRSQPYAGKDNRRRNFVDAAFRKLQNVDNHYLQDREKQRTENFTGMGPIFPVHDGCATETMGALYDRSREHLGSSDKAVIAMRRYLLDAIARFQQGATPPHVITDPALNDMRHAESLSGIIDGDDWHAHYPQLVTSAAEVPAEVAPVSGGGVLF
ncbi:MAG: phthalate 4,5-dioxygenase [Chloroflexota bacterium]|jgi:nitrite reductase/ring-hydroxylating ferredoxin subunit|nr:phthalate 4,5-dioxygenase [Chloroflexota bacterium]